MRTPATALMVLVAAAAAWPAPAGPPAPALPSGPDPRVARLLEQVSADRLAARVRRLESFVTRHTLSDPSHPTRGIGAAREWIRQELQAASPRLQVAFDTHRVPPHGSRVFREVELRNVVAVLPGRSPRRLYVSAHYDTVSRPAPPPGQPPHAGPIDWRQPDLPAPGANDDGSGTALVMELAQVLAASGLEYDATLVFALFAGEEEGLVGATLHAARLREQGVAVEAVLNNDIVGNDRGGDGVTDSASVRVFADGPEDSPSRQLARAAVRVAALYEPGHRVRPVARSDRFGRGGDHTPFHHQGWAAVRFTESREDYSRQHTVADTSEGVAPEYLARNARVNAALLATLALAPPAPVVVDERGAPLLERGATGYDAHLRWHASPGAAAYRVRWREAWTPDWQHERVVGPVAELVLPGLSIDDHVFAVSALSAGGHESLAAAYVNPGRAPLQVPGAPGAGSAP